MKIRLSEYEEGVVDGREESAEIMRLKQSEIEALTAHIINLTKGTIRQQQAEIEALKQQLVTTSSEAKLNYNKGHEDGRKLAVVKQITDEEIHQAIRRGFSRDGFLSDGIFLEIKELLRNKQGVNSEQVPDFFFMENDLMGKR